MTGIWEFPELEELEQFIIDGIANARQQVIENFEEEEDEERADTVRRLKLERILVVDEWGMGDAEIGRDTLDVFLFFSMEGEEQEHLASEFDPAARTVVQQFNFLINQGDIAPPELAIEWFPNFDAQPVAISRFEDQASLSLGRGIGNRIYDVTASEAILFTEPPEAERPGERPPPRPFTQLPRVTLQTLREQAQRDEEDIEEEEGVIEEPEPEPEIEIEPEPLTAEEQIRRSLSNFTIDTGDFEIPAGKPTRRIEFRELYDFELRIGLPSTVLGELDGFAPGDQITTGIGFNLQLGRVGTDEPASTFPRTSQYVKWYLRERGPQYILALYKDLIVYSGFISGFYNMKLRPGRYDSFRNFMYRVNQIGRRGGPELIRALSQQQASARGFETIPDHPTIEGEKAPWLERRQYYEIVEENFDHEAWRAPVEYLYEEVGEAV